MGKKHIDRDLFAQMAPHHTAKELAEIFGIGVKWAATLRTRTTPSKRVDIDGLIEAAKTGKYTSMDLAQLFGTTRNWAQILCKRHGITPKQHWVDEDTTRWPEPTDAPPGTEAKIEVLRGRAERGEILYHPDDAIDWERLVSRLTFLVA